MPRVLIFPHWIGGGGSVSGIFRGVQAVVLVFGSYSCPLFRRDLPRLNHIYDRYRDRAAFYLVYIQEAHPSDGRQLASNIKGQVVFASPKGFANRRHLANTCVRKLGIRFPVLVDEPNDSTEEVYTA